MTGIDQEWILRSKIEAIQQFAFFLRYNNIEEQRRCMYVMEELKLEYDKAKKASEIF